MELTLPAEPVALYPGVPTRVPVQVRNPYAQRLDLRVYMAKGRAAGWATVDPESLQLGPGETAEVQVVLCTPAEQPPSKSLVPFTVHAEEAGTGEPAGFATALLTVSLPVPVIGRLVARPESGHLYDLRLANDSGHPTGVRIKGELDPPAGSVSVEPEAVLLEPGTSAVVAVRAKPSRPLSGAAKSYVVVVKVSDAYDAEREPYLVATAGGTRKARLPKYVLGATAIVLALGATAAIALTGGGRDLIPRRKAPTAAVAQVTVGKPYALVDVFPHKGADGGKGAADAALATAKAAGMPVKLVDSLSSDVLTDENGGFWVLLQDGFTSQATAGAYCAQWRLVAPKCQVVS